MHSATPSDPTRARIRHLRFGITLVVVVLLALAAWRGLEDRTPVPMTAAPATPPSSPAPTPTTHEIVRIPLGPQDTIAIAAAGAWHQDITLPDRACTLTGAVRGIAGGKKDFEAFIADDEGYRNWDVGHEFETRWRTEGQVTSATFTLPLHGPGPFHLVVSNRFSMVMTTVERREGTADCP